MITIFGRYKHIVLEVLDRRRLLNMYKLIIA